MIIQLNPTIPVNTPKGEAIAHFLIDYGIEHDLYWVTFITETQECWTFSNRDIRACQNITIGRKEIPEKIPLEPYCDVKIVPVSDKDFSFKTVTISEMGGGNLS